MDIEELVGLAVAQDACAYYGSRTAAPLAELVVMPYTSLLHKETRWAGARSGRTPFVAFVRQTAPHTFLAKHLYPLGRRKCHSGYNKKA